MSAKRLFQVVSLLVILATLLSACAAAPAQPAAQPTEAPAAQPTAAPAAGAKPLIAGVVFQSDTFMQTVQAGMQAAADKAGAGAHAPSTVARITNKLTSCRSLFADMACFLLW